MNATVKLLFLTDRLKFDCLLQENVMIGKKNQKLQKSLNSHFTINDFSDS